MDPVSLGVPQILPRGTSEPGGPAGLEPDCSGPGLRPGLAGGQEVPKNPGQAGAECPGSAVWSVPWI